MCSSDLGNQFQSLAYSTDKGRTWNLYNNGDPVLDIGSNEFRDPKVFWDQTSGRWTMVASHATEHRVSFYSSPDLIHWTEQSSFGGEGITIDTIINIVKELIYEKTV